MFVGTSRPLVTRDGSVACYALLFVSERVTRVFRLIQAVQISPILEGRFLPVINAAYRIQLRCIYIYSFPSFVGSLKYIFEQNRTPMANAW